MVEKFPSIHEELATDLNRYLQEIDIQKDLQKRTASKNSRPITWQIIIWKILTV